MLIRRASVACNKPRLRAHIAPPANALILFRIARDGEAVSVYFSPKNDET
jgi:hypothetical protein